MSGSYDKPPALPVVNLTPGNLKLVKPSLDYDQAPVKRMMTGIEEMNKLLETLAEDPFREIPDELVEINQAIARAARKVVEQGLGRVNLTRCEKDIPRTLASYPVLSEIFRIFFKNGLEAMHEAGKQQDELTVSSKYDQEKKQIVITVKDIGIGIDAADIENIFDFKWTTKKTKGGLGFGLFWAKETIEENLGGSIIVESVVGQGTTFRILLPVENASQGND